MKKSRTFECDSLFKEERPDVIAVQDHSCVFHGSQRRVHCEFIVEGQTVNDHCYLEVVTGLREFFGEKTRTLV